MKQITEDYCSFETAKLLKEKGFINDWCVKYYDIPYYTTSYHPLKDCKNLPSDYNFLDFECSAPTHQMALKWLREVHNIYIDILTYTTGKDIQFRWVGYEKGRLFSQEEGKTIYFESYENTVEAAILYVLKNLI